MSEFIITSEQLKTATEAYLERELSRPITEVFISGDKLPEIVRCRDCKYANEDGDECVYFAAWEPLPEGDEFRDVYVDVEPDGFCAWGERRE